MRTESDSERDAEGGLAIADPASTAGNSASTASDDHTVAPAARTSPDNQGARGTGGLRNAVSSRFRLPGEDDPSPRSGRLLGLCTWAAAMAFLGLIPGGRLAFSLALNLDMPSWYAPVALTLGVLGVAAVAAGFFAIHRHRLPLYLFTAATLLLLTNLTLVYAAF
ncbi:hypothetical protein [Catellatospora bangladeshensis]|uniref:Uncharacterized protein n=2 Tax=Catellatospora bangladeshensis TaxID=310355 RepID=A0A8J3NM64_9ACTN|nr:hypothetical protein [Catellatospora bangladeshensis]GIF84763.1 hypothetical protein Cba03nite_61120 [Catellatospora bangladeshensis]